jgi:hypothetical protein
LADENGKDFMKNIEVRETGELSTTELRKFQTDI